MKKHPCRKSAESSFSAVRFHCLPPSTALLSSRKLFPTEERKLREALWFHLERGGGGFFTEESMATTTRKKSTQEEEHFSLHIQQGFASMFAFRIVESWVTAFCSLPSLPVPSCCPSQPHIDMRKPILLLCYRPTTFVTSHQQRTLRRCPPLSAGTGARQ